MASFHDDFRIGDWHVSPKLNRISRAGESIHLKHKSVQVLTYLADAGGDVVSRNDLMDAVWPGMTVTDDVLTQCIVELRRAFGDDAKSPQYIETIPKVGFRLVAPVLPVDESVNDEPGPAKLPGWVQIAVAVLLAAGIGSWASWQSARDPVIEVEQSRSIAVLPFVNLSGDPDNEFFSDGIAEEILILLGKIPDLKVIGRTSSFSFKGKNEDIRTIGQVLGVNNLVEGSVRISGDRVRVSAKLLDVFDGSEVWSDSYNSDLTDIFDVQDEIALAIIRALQIHVDVIPSRGKPTANAAAYANFLRAKASMSASRLGDTEQFLLRAIGQDPEFAEAHEYLAYCYWYGCGGPFVPGGRAKRIYELGNRAFDINPNLVFAEAMHLQSTLDERNFIDRLRIFERAVQKDPANPVLLETLSWDLGLAGYLREALAVATELVEQDPLSLPANNTYWRALYGVGRKADAFAAMEVFERLGGSNSPWVRGRLDLGEGRDESAIANFEHYLENEGDSDTGWVRKLVTGARSATNGPAYLDRGIDDYIATLPDERQFEMRQTMNRWYLHLGFLDRFFDSIPEPGAISEESVWQDIEDPVQEATMIRESGFTAHPRYLDLARNFGLMETWEQRRPPDFCEKSAEEWICH